LPQLNPLQDELERAYEKHVAGNPDQAAARIWTAERVGIPQWIQDRDEMYAKEAETRLALLEKKSPDWNRMVAFSPATSKFLSYDDVMASAYDDVDNLAAMEEEAKRAARVKKNLNGLLQRGASGRTAIMRKLKADIKPSDIVPGTSDTAKGTVSMYGHDADTFAPGAIRGRDTDTSQSIDINKALGDWFMSTDIGKGYASGKEMSEIGIEAVNLFAAESATGQRDEAKWVELEKRRLALDREMPEGWFGEMLFATGKLYGQQASGAVRTSAMAATGAALGAAAVGATAPVSLPAIGIVAGMTSLLGWKIGADLGVFTQSGQIEAGHDLIERRMMKDAEGNHLSPMAVGLGSMTTGALAGALEVAFWTIPFNPLGKTAAAVKIQQAVIPKVAARISKLPAFVKMAGMTAKNIVVNDFYESGTEVLQDAIPIAIDEFQKAALLDGHDMRSIGDISAQLQDTFRQSMFDFALISAIGPVAAGVRGDYRAEIIRKEMEARQVQHMNSNLDNFAAKIGASKLLQRIPGMSKDFAGELLDGADARTVYVPATSVQQMFQDGLIETEQEDAAAWAEETLGVDPEDFRSSLDGGPDIEIEAIKLFDSVPDKAQDMIRKSMRFAADGMTLGEAEAMNERITKIRQGDLFNVAYELEREVSEAASAHKVFESMRLQMEAQGMDPEIAANTAWAASRMYIPMARMWNEKRTSQDLITPEDVAEMFPISFTQNDDGSMGMYFQALGEKGARNYDAAFATIKLDNLAIAKEKIAAGEDPQKIKMAFGWELGADGKWRMETKDDLRLKANPGTKEWRDLFLHKEKYGPARHALLSEVISFDELFTAYPDMADMKVFVDLDDDTTSGYYSERENAIHLSYKTGNNPVEVFHTLTHEIQHAIQRREGFARGGSPDSFIDDFYETKQYKDAEEVFSLYSNLKYLPKFFNYLEFNKRGRGIISPTGIYLRPWDEQYKEFADEKKLKEDFDQFKENIKDIEVDGEKLFDKLLRQYEEYDKKLIEYEKKYDSDLHTYIRKDSELSKQYALEQYYRLAGEVEARNTETRLGMPSSERYATLMSETEDVSREDQIILGSMLRKAELAEELRGFQASYNQAAIRQ
ncbi:MAG: hypothetical protein GX625_16000, partial [Clostridiaceae bacterium]|nr:hypothetical protein [Clostridiaceae bacterium]